MSSGGMGSGKSSADPGNCWPYPQVSKSMRPWTYWFSRFGELQSPGYQPQTPTAPFYVQANTAVGVTTPGVAQSSIVLPYTAAGAGHTLVAIILTGQSYSGNTMSGPGGNWTKATQVEGGDGSAASNFEWCEVGVFVNAAVDASTTATFSFSSCTCAGLVYEIGSTSGPDTTHLFSQLTSSTGDVALTGSGTAQEANDWEIIGGVLFDSNFSVSTAPSGFTTDLTLADHGDGGATFGSSQYLAHRNAINTSTAVTAQTITYDTPGGAGINGFGFTLLLRPIILGFPTQPHYQRDPILAQ